MLKQKTYAREKLLADQLSMDIFHVCSPHPVITCIHLHLAVSWVISDLSPPNKVSCSITFSGFFNFTAIFIPHYPNLLGLKKRLKKSLILVLSFFVFKKLFYHKNLHNYNFCLLCISEGQLLTTNVQHIIKR